MHLLFPTPGCQVRDLLSDADRSDCDTQDDGLCRCTLLSRSGRYGLMYNSNSPGSIADYFIDPNYCWDLKAQLEYVRPVAVGQENNLMKMTSLIVNILYR